LTGGRTPPPDPLACGTFDGLTVRHALPHLTRAVIEGVSFRLRDSFELIKNVGTAQINEMYIIGGGTKSPLWRQILADILDVELTTVASEKGAAYEVALLAAVGTGDSPMCKQPARM
jgi:xylulokinase